MNHIYNLKMSVGKILSSSLFRQQVQRTFILHRDLRSCLSLSEAQKMVAERQHQIKDYGKTAFLQFLNSFPLNYSYKRLSSPLKVFMLSAELQNLSTYEQQLRYTVLIKLKQYVCMAEKGTVQELINKSQQALLQIKKNKPFDTTHALNFLLLQKDSKNNQLFQHCLDVIKKTDYQLFKTLIHRMIPIFIKRLGPDDWNVIRRFDYLIEALTFDFLPKDIMTIHYSFFIEKISEMQLHTVAYHKIPPAIDFIIGYYVKQIESNRQIQLNKLQIMLKAFDYLPIGYNQHAFNIFYNKLLQKCEKETVHIDNLPYRRLTSQQVATLITNGGLKQSTIHQLVYFGNVVEARKAILNSDYPKKIYDEFMNYHPHNGKNLVNSLMAATILIQYYKNDSKVKEKIRQKIKSLLKEYRIDISKYIKFFSISSIFNLITLEKQVQIGGLNTLIDLMTSEIIQRANNDDFKQLKFFDNIIEAVYLYSESPYQQIRTVIISTIMGMTQKNDKFFYGKYSELIFILCKSQYYNEYKKAIDEMLKRINRDDCGYLVELFNRYPSKTMKMFNNFLGLVKKIDSTFQCMGRFMIVSSYTNFTSSRGELQLEFRKILQAIEPLLSVNSLKGYYLPEITLILKFCVKFYYYISQFSRKMLIISLNYLQSLDCTKDGGKFMLNCIQEAISLKLISNSSEQIDQKIMNLIKKLCESFPQSLLLRAKQIQFRWLLGNDQTEDRRSLLVEQVLNQLSSQNYSDKHTDVMIILLKLNSLNVIKLKAIVEQKLLSLIISSIENNQIKINDIINQLYLPFKKGGSSIDQVNAGGISKILKHVLEKIGAKQNFEYYMRMIEFADYIKDSELLGKTLECMSETHMSPSQIKKILNVVRFHRNIETNKFAYKLLKDTDVLFDYLKSDCSQILYSAHLSKNDCSKQELQLTTKLLNRHEQFLKDSLDKHEFSQVNLLASIIKHLWVSLKINKFSSSMSPLFKFAVLHYQETKNDKNKGNFFGIPNENIALIYETIIKFSQANDPKFFDSFKQQQKKTLFKSASKAVPSVVQNLQQENKKLLDFLASFFTAQQQKILAHELTKKGFHIKSKDNVMKNNIFQLNKEINGVKLNGWVIKDNIEYGIIYINQRYLTINKNLKGRTKFTINCLQMITGIKIIPFRPDRQLKFE